MNINLFDLVTLTAAINEFPRMYGRLGELNLFPFSGVTNPTVVVERNKSDLVILPTNPYGGVGSVGKRDQRDAVPILIPSTVHEDKVLAAGVQSIRAFGSESDADPMAAEVAKVLQRMNLRHQITWEWRRAKALQGIILDADGSTVLLDVFTRFGITQNSVDFVLGTTTTPIRNKCADVSRLIEDNLSDEVMTGVHVLCGTTWFDRFVEHPNVKAAYQNYQLAAERLGGDVRKGFEYGGLVFEEYRAKATVGGSVVPFIPLTEAYAFPLGTVNTFETNGSPADFNETVNTVGLPMYAKIDTTKFDRGYDLHTQSNTLPIVKRPAVVIKLHTSN